MVLNGKALAAAAALTLCADLSATAASAQEACPDGSVSIVRLSKLTPGGTMAGFAKAIADHSKWYADHGYGDQIYSAPVLVYDKASRSLVRSPDEIMTFHNHAMNVPVEKHDAAWAAYVAEYRANSTIASETMVCLPK